MYRTNSDSIIIWEGVDGGNASRGDEGWEDSLEDSLERRVRAARQLQAIAGNSGHSQVAEDR